MRKYIVYVIVIVIFLSSYTLFYRQGVQKREAPVVGISFDSLVSERWIRDLEILNDTAEEFDYVVLTQIANASYEKQIDQINYLIDQGIDILIVVPNDAKKLNDVISRAKREGIYVIAYDRLVEHESIDLYISFNNIDIGEMMAMRLFEEFGSEMFSEKKNIVILNGDPDDHNALMLNAGFHSVIDEGYSVNIISEEWAIDWDEEYASDTIERVLRDGIKIDGIIAANDALAGSAIDVLSTKGLAGSVYVVGQDADLAACQRIAEGTQLATIYKPISSLAKNTIIATNSFMNTGEYNLTTDYFYDSLTIPYFGIAGKVVDTNSMESIIINSGFHREEDIYRHVNN